MSLRTIEWVQRPDGEGFIRLVDQTLLPGELRVIETCDLEEIREAICALRVRGAPAIGIAAAMGVAAAAQEARPPDVETLRRVVDRACRRLAGSRPTAVNLFWALERMRACCRRCNGSAGEGVAALVDEACAIRDEDADMCRAIGEHGAGLLRDGAVVLTHCNAGGLATAEFGTALAPVYVAARQGRKVSVFADETRPLLQGARLTAWELAQAGISVTVLCDGAAAHLMAGKRIDAVLVGADRIAANGDAANKIGTYGLAVAAAAHDIPFYVLAPTSTVDLNLPTGDEIPIEQRAAEEVSCGFGCRTVPDGVNVFNPAFDVTPSDLITAIVTERGVLRPPFAEELRRAVSEAHET